MDIPGQGNSSGLPVRYSWIYMQNQENWREGIGFISKQVAVILILVIYFHRLVVPNNQSHSPFTKVYFYEILSSKITADGDYTHEIKRHLLLGRKAMTNLDSLLKSRDVTLPTKVHLVKAMVFPVVVYGCESWTIRKAERRRIDAFELCCWKRRLRVPWTARSKSPS